MKKAPISERLNVKQEALKVGFEPTKIVLQTIEYTIPPHRYLLYASL